MKQTDEGIKEAKVYLRRSRAQVESVSAGMVSHAQCPPNAAGSRQGAMQAVGYAAEATEADRAAEHSARHEARYTKLSNADGTAHCGRVGSRHFQSLEEHNP